MIDEAGKMWPNRVDTSARKDVTFQVTRWCRTLRHEGARLVLVVQDEKQLDASLRRLVAVELHTTNLADRREPVTGTIIGDWLQIMAKLTGRYVTWCREIEMVADGAGMVEEHAYARPMLTRYFKLYRAHNREDGSSGGEEKMEWERFGVVRFFFWVWSRNWPQWSWRVGIALLMVALFLPPLSLGFRGWNWICRELSFRMRSAKCDKAAGRGCIGARLMISRKKCCRFGPGARRWMGPQLLRLGRRRSLKRQVFKVALPCPVTLAGLLVRLNLRNLGHSQHGRVCDGCSHCCLRSPPRPGDSADGR